MKIKLFLFKKLKYSGGNFRERVCLRERPALRGEIHLWVRFERRAPSARSEGARVPTARAGTGHRSRTPPRHSARWYLDVGPLASVHLFVRQERIRSIPPRKRCGQLEQGNSLSQAIPVLLSSTTTYVSRKTLLARFLFFFFNPGSESAVRGTHSDVQEPAVRLIKHSITKSIWNTIWILRSPWTQIVLIQLIWICIDMCARALV